MSLGLLSLASIGHMALVAIGTWCNPAIGYVAPTVDIRSLASISSVAPAAIDVRSVVSIGCMTAATVIVQYVVSIGSLAHAAIGFRSFASVPLLSLLSYFLMLQYIFYFCFGYLE
ncbi:unnamed protein product [Lactuca saligna]|uniref:NADH:quinone oxidoreductase/Mrp antiporter membrane subunit domain-containing protein n=1 Tax=Lactuca saligna TaxID=75948 RepID=A0AA36A362_LACSI|nr:unnamed protein product [Lactuca saligna]